MIYQNTDDIYRLLNELKAIVDIANENLNVTMEAKSKIDTIISELKKDKSQRDCNKVILHMIELESVKGISDYIHDLLPTIDGFCNGQ